MENIKIQHFIKKAANLQNFKTIQFLAQFLVFSKYQENSPVFQEFLAVTQMIKFIFRLTEYYRSYRHPTDPKNIYMQKPTVANNIQSSIKQRIQNILHNIKTAPWSKNDFQSQIFQQFPNGKKIQLISSKQIPKQFNKKRFNYRQIIGQILLILRPLLSIIAIRAFGVQSYIPYCISLIIDLIVLLLQRKASLLSHEQAIQWASRHRDILWRCLFKRPFYQIFKNSLLIPLLKKFMRQDRIIYKIIMYIVEIQSSITLTL